MRRNLAATVNKHLNIPQSDDLFSVWCLNFIGIHSFRTCRASTLLLHANIFENVMRYKKWILFNFRNILQMGFNSGLFRAWTFNFIKFLQILKFSLKKFQVIFKNFKSRAKLLSTNSLLKFLGALSTYKIRAGVKRLCCTLEVNSIQLSSKTYVRRYLCNCRALSCRAMLPIVF
jgi:hypothetical protein